MEKLSKNIHNHTFTDLIKICVFALLLLLPGIMFLPSCLYYGFNEHATNTGTTTINYKYDSNEVNSVDDLVEGHIYRFDLQNDTLDQALSFTSVNNAYCEFLFIHISSFDLSNYEFLADDYYTIFDNGFEFDFNLHIYQDYSASYTFFNASNGSLETGVIEPGLDNDSFTLIGDFIYLGGNDLVISEDYIVETDYNVIESVSVNTDDTISTKLYRSWEQMWNTHLFSWTNNTPLNTGINGFIGVFGINSQSYLGNVLIWLLSITAIYVVIDIVIGVFKWLTHLIGNH